eukprot:6895337-Ditylum_brightwellii.AAC.1
MTTASNLEQLRILFQDNLLEEIQQIFAGLAITNATTTPPPAILLPTLPANNGFAEKYLDPTTDPLLDWKVVMNSRRL